MIGQDDPVNFNSEQSYVVVDLGGMYIYIYLLAFCQYDQVRKRTI